MNINRAILIASAVAASAFADASSSSVSSSALAADGAGRKIMRMAEGGLVSVRLAKSTPSVALELGRSVDNGRMWSYVKVPAAGSVAHTALDSNFQASYIAFTERQGNEVVGRVALTTSPLSNNPQIVVSGQLTPAGVKPVDTFVQASRKDWGEMAGADSLTVVYGWQDSKSKSLYIGVSPDGKSFPMAKAVVEDQQAVSGPSVAIRGNNIIAAYLTRNPEIAPIDVGEQQGRAYQAYIESSDGGATWTRPKPVFGRSTKDFPAVQVADKGVGAKSEPTLLAGGTALGQPASLGWEASRDPTPRGRIDSSETGADKAGRATYFLQSSLAVLNSDGSVGEVGVVSSRDVALPNAPWVHAVANNKLTAKSSSVNQSVSSTTAQTSQFQYSALIDTPIRATSYREFNAATKQARLVLAISTDTGKRFDQHLSLDSGALARLGLQQFGQGTAIAASQCLFEDRDGNVYLDLVASANGGETRYARVPIGVNASRLRQQEAQAALPPARGSVRLERQLISHQVTQ